MATRLSKAEGFSGLWTEMIRRSNQTYYDVTLEKLKKADRLLQRNVRKYYGAFFLRIALDVVGAYDGSIGRTLKDGWPAWSKLSDKWLEEKSHNISSDNFYSGISGSTKATNASSFFNFLYRLSPQDVDRIMGPLVIEYSFRPAGKKKYVTQDLQKTVDLAQLVTQTKKAEFPEALMITAEVKAFQKLSGVKMREWDIVDKIIQTSGNYEQWRKINGTSFGRNGRPVRALIGPEISRYMNKVATPALKRFNGTLA